MSAVGRPTTISQELLAEMQERAGRTAKGIRDAEDACLPLGEDPVELVGNLHVCGR
jgi:hypothetical protein